MTLDAIEHVVLVMFENRSFDSLLGWLHAEEGSGPALNIPEVPAGGRRFEGLQGLDLTAFTNEAAGFRGIPVRGASSMNVPCVAPNEPFESVNVQLFGKADVEPGETPAMNGFLRDYAAAIERVKVLAGNPAALPALAGEVLESYVPEQLPVINGLAEHYAVSDMWFSSVPSQTNGNRAFAFCGTSLGLTDNGFLEKDPRARALEDLVGYPLGDDQFETGTLWNALHDAGHDDWSIFWQTSTLPEKISEVLTADNTFLGPVVEAVVDLFGDLDADHQHYLRGLTSGALESCYTYRLFPALQQIPGVADHFGSVKTFHEQARAGKLPRFSFVEPAWTISEESTDLTRLQSLATQMGSDYHPPCNLGAGESFLQSIYESLIANREAWEKTLLIVVFDEAVGSFDHVPPPAAVPPWGSTTPSFDLEHDFSFDRHGVRVPALLISPRIPRGTVFRSTVDQPYDHTSLIATLLKWYKAEDLLPRFQERARGAPTFEGVVTLTEPRTDEREIRFLAVERKAGQPLRYFERFQLRSHYGEYLSTFRRESTPAGVFSESDPQAAQFFPTLGERAVHLFLECGADEARWDQVPDGAAVSITSTEMEIGAYNTLGSWTDALKCYYYNDYERLLDETRFLKQTWTIASTSRGTPLRFGDTVTLQNQHYKKSLCRREDGLTIQREAYPWTIEPIVAPTATARSVRPGDVVVLKNRVSGLYVTAAKRNYPTLGQGAPTQLALLPSSLRPDGLEVVVDGAAVELAVSEKDPSFSKDRYLLGAWTLDHHLYYDTVSTDATKHSFRIVRCAGNGVIEIGDPVLFVSLHPYTKRFVAPDSERLTTVEERSAACEWIVERPHPPGR
ncbi:MAG: alkaline phosphatase family protein [Byssovorax sp.]